jgi:hypothetical protein
MSALPASLSSLLNNPVEFFRECDRLATTPHSSNDRGRWASLRMKARTVGLNGSERTEFILLDKRRNS